MDKELGLKALLEAIYKKKNWSSGGDGPHWTSGLVRAVAPIGPVIICKLRLDGLVLRVTLRLVAFNFVERELKNINFHFCYAQAL